MLTFVSRVLTFVSRVLTFASRVLTFVSRVLTFVSRVLTFVSRVLTFVESNRFPFTHHSSGTPPPPTSTSRQCFYERTNSILRNSEFQSRSRSGQKIHIRIYNTAPGIAQVVKMKQRSKEYWNI